MLYKTETIAQVVAGASAFAIFISSFRKWKQNRFPTKWEAIGEITDVFIFPIKSCGVIKVNEVDCVQLGTKNRFLRDRSFMIVKDDGRFVSARHQPKLVTIMPEIFEQKLKLSAPGMIDIAINLDKIISNNIKERAYVLDDIPVEVYNCGADVSQWISKYILNENSGLRLVYYPLDYPTKSVRVKELMFSMLTPDHVGALHDATSFMMINESSIADLNTRIPFNVTPLQFRPNFVVKGPKAFDEDNYDWIKIGNTILKSIKPCLRCIFTNIDPTSGERFPNNEPLKTLKSYRNFSEWGDSPVMGIHLGIWKPGQVKNGDIVYASC